MTFKAGAQGAVMRHVTQDDTAVALGSGDLEVLATPRLVAWFEQATLTAIEAERAQTTVGAHVAIDHERASPVGAEVTVRAELAQVTGRQLRFDVVAEQEEDGVREIVARGRVTRVVVDRSRFLRRFHPTDDGSA